MAWTVFVQCSAISRKLALANLQNAEGVGNICGKECQSITWSEGHKLWCSAKPIDEDGHERSKRHHDRDHDHHRDGHEKDGDVEGQGGGGSMKRLTREGKDRRDDGARYDPGRDTNHDHNHHIALNYVSPLSMSLIFRLLLFSTIVALIFHLYLNYCHLSCVIIPSRILGRHFGRHVKWWKFQTCWGRKLVEFAFWSR